MQVKNVRKVCAALTVSALFIAGCFAESGHRGGDTLTGTATAGTPLSGIITIKDSSNPPRQIVTTSRADGTYSADVAGMQSPFSIEATGPSGGTSYTLHTVVNRMGKADINPLTEVAVAVAAHGDNAAMVYNYPENGKIKEVGNRLPQALASLGTRLRPLFEGFGIAVDGITGQLNGGRKSFETLFASVEFVYANNILMVVNKATKAAIFACQINNIEGGTFSAGNIPAISAGSAT